jgi:glutamate dehydrogenase/leucine dehydrogenase
VRIERLRTVDGFVAFDLDDASVNAGGTRFAPDVSEAETALLARAMTYKFAVLGRRTGGAKGALRGTPEEKPAIMRRYCDEVRPMARSGKFLTGADLGTSYDDFAALRNPSEPRHVMGTSVDGVPLEDLVTGLGVVAGAETAIGSLEGQAIALEGFGKVGSGVAREAVRRGARVIAISTIAGCAYDPSGLDVELMLTLRSAHGDAFVTQLRTESRTDPRALFDIPADILVPGARTGVIDERIAGRLAVRWIAPAANAPYTKTGIDVLNARGIRFLPDFVLNAGAVVGFVCGEETAAGVLREAEQAVTNLIAEAAVDPSGPYAAACRIAQRFLATWRPPDGMPDSPPLA